MYRKRAKFLGVMGPICEALIGRLFPVLLVPPIY